MVLLRKEVLSFPRKSRDPQKAHIPVRPYRFSRLSSNLRSGFETLPLEFLSSVSAPPQRFPGPELKIRPLEGGFRSGCGRFQPAADAGADPAADS